MRSNVDSTLAELPPPPPPHDDSSTAPSNDSEITADVGLFARFFPRFVIDSLDGADLSAGDISGNPHFCPSSRMVLLLTASVSATKGICARPLGAPSLAGRG